MNLAWLTRGAASAERARRQRRDLVEELSKRLCQCVYNLLGAPLSKKRGLRDQWSGPIPTEPAVGSVHR